MHMDAGQVQWIDMIEEVVKEYGFLIIVTTICIAYILYEEVKK